MAEDAMWAGRLRRAALPLTLLALVGLSVVPGARKTVGFDPALAPMLIGGGVIAYRALVAALEQRRVTAGLLVVIAIVGSAYVEEYLAAAVVAFMMVGGEFLEDLTLDRTRNSLRALFRLTPDTATVWDGAEWRSAPVAKAKPGDRLLVKTGECVPVDGRVVHGHAALNEATLTGEPMPVDKTAGDPVFTGTLVTSGAVEMVAEKVGRDTTLARILQTVREAQERKGDIQRTADRFAAWFTPLVLLIGGAVWVATHDLLRVMSVFVVACPCALVLATPTAVVAAVGNAARRGIVIKGGAALETLGRVNAVCFDKTGTLTQGAPEVVHVHAFVGSDVKAVLEVAALAESRSEHPVAAAIGAAYRERFGEGPAFREPDEFLQRPGVGVTARSGELTASVGNRLLLADLSSGASAESAAFLEEHERKGHTALVVARNGVLVGGIALADTVRESAADGIQLLRRMGVRRVLLLTGDNPIAARAVADQVGVGEVRAGLLPAEKLRDVDRLRAEGWTVAMVGDGVNDAPALAAADVGIAVGAVGTDVAIETASVALMGDDLRALAGGFALARRSVRVIQQSIWFFAVGANAAGVALASVGILSPIGAAVAHNIASLFVVMNATRLLSAGRTRV